jgi:hypothetical protein
MKTDKTNKTRQLADPEGGERRTLTTPEPGQTPPARTPAAPAPTPSPAGVALSGTQAGQLTELAQSVPTAIQAANDAQAAAQAAQETNTQLSQRIEAVEQRAAHLPDAQNIEDRFAQLATGDQLTQLSEQVNSLQAQFGRVQTGGGPAPQRGFAATVAENPELVAWQRQFAETPSTPPLIMSVPHIGAQFAQLAAARALATVNDADYLGALAPEARKPGVQQLLRTPIGLVDIVNTVQQYLADSYAYVMETDKNKGGHLATKVRTAGTGGTTPVSAVDVDDVIGWKVGDTVVFHTSNGAYDRPITSITATAGSEAFGFATNTIDFDVAVGDDVTGVEYLATGETDQAGAGVMEVVELNAPFLSLPNYVILTRQRITRSTLLDVVAYAESLLTVRSKENLESMLLYGDGTNPTQLQGFLTHSAIASQTDLWSSMNVGDTRADAILWAACKIPGNPVIKAVLHSKDWFWITTQKGSDGHYINPQMGPVAITDTPTRKAIGSVEVVLSDRIAQSTSLVLAPEPASDLVPGPNSTITWGYINAQLVQGKTTALLNADWAHAIKDTKAFRKVSFDGAPSA